MLKIVQKKRRIDAPPFSISREKKSLLNTKVQSMLKKSAIQAASYVRGEFNSKIFLVGKKDGGHQTVKILKKLK